MNFCIVVTNEKFRQNCNVKPHTSSPTTQGSHDPTSEAAEAAGGGKKRRPDTAVEASRAPKAALAANGIPN